MKTDDFDAENIDQIDEWEKRYNIKLHELREQYEKRKPYAEAVAERVEDILRKYISDSNLKCEVTSRIKDFNSFRMKFRKLFIKNYNDYKDHIKRDGKNKEKYENNIKKIIEDPFENIKDIIGIRCIGLFTSQTYPVNKDNDALSGEKKFLNLRELIKNNFSDVNGKMPRSEQTTVDNITYRNYYLKLRPESIIKGIEDELIRYSFELQIRAYPQHLYDNLHNYLSYVCDSIFFTSDEFKERSLNLQKQLINIQHSVDQLYEDSQKEFNVMRRMIEDGDCTKLVDLPITPSTLKLFAFYEFCIVKENSNKFPNLPKNFDDIEFVDLWLNELSDCLNKIGFKTIEEIQRSTLKGIKFVVDHYYQSRKYIYKENDLTDILSKCLLFSIKSLRSIYPIRSETKEQIEGYLTNNNHFE